MTPMERLLAELDRPFAGDVLFDAISDIVYFLKDRDGRYAAVNRALAERTGRKRKDELIGLTAEEAFSGPLGRRIGAQDRALLAGGRPLRGELELHLYAERREGWCLTWKEPLFGRKGEVVGLVGLSRDLPRVDVAADENKALAAAMNYAREHLDTALRVPDLAARAGLSPFRFDQKIRLMFGQSAGQYLTRARIDRACLLLRRGDTPISQIALDSGYADQTAFTRQFRKVVGLSPLQYRTSRG